MKATRIIRGEDYPLRDLVRDEIRDRISDGRLGPGEHLYDVRSALIELAFRRAAENATSRQVEHLRALIERTSVVSSKGDHSEATRLNAEFHETVIDAPGNPYLSSAYAALIGRLRWFTNRSREYERHIAEHSALAEAITARAVERAGALVAAHINTGRAHGLQQSDDASTADRIPA